MQKHNNANHHTFLIAIYVIPVCAKCAETKVLLPSPLTASSAATYQAPSQTEMGKK